MKQLYQVLEVAPSTFHIFEPAGVGSTLIVGETSALLIDTGYGFEDISLQVREITDLPLQLVNTHCHLDHAGGNHFFQQKAFIHPKETDLYRVYQLDKPGHLTFVENKANRGKIANPFPKGFDPESYIQYTPVEFQYLSDHQKFDLGGRVVETIFFPGHTEGSVAFYDHLTKTLISGDNLGSSLWIFFPQSAPVEVYQQALKEIMANYDIEQVLYSHSAIPYPAQFMEKMLEGIQHRCQETDKEFIHPRHGFRALHHVEPLENFPSVQEIHIVYPFSLD